MDKVLPEANNVFPCETKWTEKGKTQHCPNMHSNLSGYCEQCTRKSSLLPPGLEKRLGLAGRQAQLLLITLVMSYFETDDKILLVGLSGSIALICVFFVITRLVVRGGLWWAALAAIVLAIGLAAWFIPQLVKTIDKIDDVKRKYDEASEKLGIPRLRKEDPEALGLGSRLEGKNKLRQEKAELRDLYAEVQRLEGRYKSEILDFLKGFEGQAAAREIKRNIKGVYRARQKMNDDYNKDASRLKDLLRGTVVCKTIDDFGACFRGLVQLERSGVATIETIKNSVRDGARDSGYMDANVILRLDGFLVEVQLQLEAINEIKTDHHDAYSFGRELDLMGALEKPDGLEAAPVETTIAYTLARTVPALFSLLVAILYLDVFTCRGLRLFVRRADPDTWRGFEKPYVVHRIYGVALAAPYLANVYMLARAGGLFGRAAKRSKRTRVGLLYDKYLGYEGSDFVWKVFCFQIVEVALQAAGKMPLFTTYVSGATRSNNVTFWFVFVFGLALLVNVIYPTFLLRSRLVRYQRDVSYVVDTFLDIVYALTPFVFLIAGVRSQAVLIPHEPIAYVSNLVPMLHAHFVISTLERAGAEARALKRVAPNEIAADDEAPIRVVAVDAPDEAAGIDAPAPDAGTLPDDASAEPSKPVPLGATSAGRCYRGLICLCLFFWTLAMGFFYTPRSIMGGSATFWFVSEVLKIKSSCTWEVEKKHATLFELEAASSDDCFDCRFCFDCEAYGTCDLSVEEKCWGQGAYPACEVLWQQCDWYPYSHRDCDPPCEDIPGCDQLDHVGCWKGTCYTGTIDSRCDGKENRFDLGDGGWCWNGRRDQECSAASTTAPPTVTAAPTVYKYGVCCVRHSFHATGEVANTTCRNGRSPWETETFSLFCTAGHSDAGAVAPVYRNCSQAAIDAGSCGTGGWRSCEECVDGNITRGTYFATVGYTSCPPWVVDAIHEDAADGGACSTVWIERTEFSREGRPKACSFQLWEDLIKTDEGEYRPWFTIMGVFVLFCFVWLPFLLSFLALPSLAERAGRRVVSVWRQTVGLILLGFVVAGILAYYHAPAPFWISRLGGVLFGYATAVVIEERVKVGAFCSVVICLTQFWWGAISGVVVGCAAVAFAPRRGEREKVRSYAHTTKASVAADRGRLPLWACCVYFCATSTFIGLAGARVLTTDPTSCHPCNCRDNTLEECYVDARTLVWTESSWNGINSFIPLALYLGERGIKAIEPGAFGGMASVEEVWLRKNRISSIEPYTFAGLNKLWGLDLTDNKIQILKSNAFLGLPRLDWLYLNDNEIQTLEVEAFLGLHGLRYLHLEENQISHIENGAFAGLDSLVWVYLQGNPVTCADAYVAGLPRSVSCDS